MARSPNGGSSATQSKPGRSMPANRMNFSGTMNPQDQTEVIRKVAQKLYEKKGCQPGHDIENWLEAEKLVKSGKV
ncbi:MAG: DUF2934 domain-containing protein [Candidatus Omnitrophota bacterium]